MTKKKDESKKGESFEASFKRLEQILEVLNEGDVGLDDALKLNDEADALIRSCSKQLTEAEQRVDKLIKRRNGELALDEEGQPQAEAFMPSQDA